MSSGAPFRIVANDGKADKMLMATQLINKRIDDIKCMREKQGFRGQDIMPSLLDLEKTHILFFNARFKPFAAIGYEYQKCTPSGSSAWGQVTQFNIPQFGDFLNDFVANARIGAVSATTGVVPAFPANVITPTASLVTATSSASWISGTAGATPVRRFTYEYVDLQGNVKTVNTAATNYVRYCEYPGERLFKKIKFEVNGNPLDEYTPETVNFYRKVRIIKEKLIGWKRLVGQEVEREAVSDLINVSGTSRGPSFAVGNVDTTGAAMNGGLINSTINVRKTVKLLDGPQTPQATQPALDLWIPLLFWFNKDVRLSVPSASIPYGQRYITFDFENQANIVSVAPGNLFLRHTIESYVTADGLVNGAGITNYNKVVTLTPVLASGSVVDTTQTISGLDLYCNNIFVTAEIHDIYIKRISFNLIRVHKMQIQRVSDATNEILMSQIKWPIEYMYIGMRPVANISSANPNQHRDWHKYTAVTDTLVDSMSKSSSVYGIATDIADTFNAAGKLKTSDSLHTGERYVAPVAVQTLDTLSVKAHGIILYQYLKSAFYRDYLTFTYGDNNISVPEDLGVNFIPYCLHPGTYQPSGHVNLSRLREFYIGYTSNYIGTSTPADMVVVCPALNFFMVSDGSAILRYAT